MTKKTILLFVKSRAAISFLESFFGKSNKFRPIFCSNSSSLSSCISKNRPSALITENSVILGIMKKNAGLPVITLIDGSREKGIEKAIEHKADAYLQKPFLESELAYKLKKLISEGDTKAKLKQEIYDLQTINELTKLISSTLDPKEILYQIVKKIAEVMPVTRCSIIQIDWLHKYAYVVASYETPDMNTIKLSLKKYPEIEEALFNKKPVIIRDINSDPLMNSVRDIVAPLGIKSILVLPIIFEEKVIGTLFLRTSRSQRSFSENEINLLHTISNASANTLYNAFLFAQIEDEKTRLEKLAITDYLTGIYNVRYFYHRIIEEFSRAERYSLPISCLMLDIDFFKKINDTYGHKTGDDVLKEFAQQLRRFTRKSDVLARYGGEEFIIMLPQTPSEGAVAEAERIREAIKSHGFKNLNYEISITISVGISTFPNPKITSHDELISSADDALYEAKNSGRDRVVMFK